MTMQIIEHVEISSTTTGFTFSNIPQDGTDLMLLASVRCATKSGFFMWINGGQTQVTSVDVTGNGSTATASQSSSSTIFSGAVPNSYTANTFSNVRVYLPSYTSSSNKTFSVNAVQENNATGSAQTILSAIRSNTAAITSIQIYGQDYASNEFLSGSSFTLYKITAGSDGTTTVS